MVEITKKTQTEDAIITYYENGSHTVNFINGGQNSTITTTVEQKSYPIEYVKNNCDLSEGAIYTWLILTPFILYLMYGLLVNILYYVSKFITDGEHVINMFNSFWELFNKVPGFLNINNDYFDEDMALSFVWNLALLIIYPILLILAPSLSLTILITVSVLFLSRFVYRTSKKVKSFNENLQKHIENKDIHRGV